MTTSANDRGSLVSREWVDEAIRRVDADTNRSADTHLHVFPLPAGAEMTVTFRAAA